MWGFLEAVGTMWDVENGVLLKEGWEFDGLDRVVGVVRVWQGSGWDSAAKSWPE